MDILSVLLRKAALLFEGLSFSLAVVIVIWLFLGGGLLIVSIFGLFGFSPKLLFKRKSVDVSKMIDESLIKKYSFIRAVTIVMFLMEFLFAACVGKLPFEQYYYKIALTFTGVLFFVTILLYLCYLAIIKPLLNSSENNSELKKQEDKIIDYKHDVNEYRKLMNLIFTLMSLLLLVLFIFYLSIPEFIEPKNLGNFKDILGYFSIPAFGASIVLIFNTEQKLENIYWTYFPDEYKRYINNYFK